MKSIRSCWMGENSNDYSTITKSSMSRLHTFSRGMPRSVDSQKLTPPEMLAVHSRKTRPSKTQGATSTAKLVTMPKMRPPMVQQTTTKHDIQHPPTLPRMQHTKLEGTTMTRPKPEWYQAAYQKLYGFLRSHHPEVLEEYRAYLKKIERRIKEGLLVLDGEG